jgi:hypothetical protein
MSSLTPKRFEPIKKKKEFFNARHSAMMNDYTSYVDKALRDIGSTEYEVIKIFVDESIETLKKYDFFESVHWFTERDAGFLVAKQQVHETVIQLIVWPRFIEYRAVTWQELQEIKNELVGPEHEGVELYPREDRNMFAWRPERMLWVSTDPKFTFPIGYSRPQIINISPEEDKK